MLAGAFSDDSDKTRPLCVKGGPSDPRGTTRSLLMGPDNALILTYPHPLRRKICSLQLKSLRQASGHERFLRVLERCPRMRPAKHEVKACTAAGGLSQKQQQSQRHDSADVTGKTPTKTTRPDIDTLIP